MDAKKLDKKYVMPTYGRFPLVLTKGKGSWVWDEKGKKYLDFVQGVVVNSLGHSRPEIANAISKQAKKLIHVSNWYYNSEQPKLAGMISKESGMEKVFFCNSGAEAIQGAIKLAQKHTKKREFIAAMGSFHGRTGAALALTWKMPYRKPFLPLKPTSHFVPYDDPKAIEKAITSKTAGVIIEPIQGEGGVVVPSKDYLKKVRKICDKKKVLMILDEVQTGFARTGKMFAFQHEGIKPDILCMAKAMGSGLPIGAFAAKDSIAKSFSPGDHASTFGGSPLVCSAAIETLKILKKKKLAQYSAKMGNYLMKELKKIRSSGIKEVRGKGLLVGIELNSPARPYCEKLIKKGLLVSPTSEKVMRLSPPLTVSKKELDMAINILKKVLE